MHIRFIVLIFLSLGITLQLKAWHDPTGPGAASSAMGGCGVASTSFWSIGNNQAGLAYQKQSSLGIYYENQFLLKEMSYNQLAGVLPVKNSAFGVQVAYFGYSDYNEQFYGLSYGRMLGERLSIGVQLDYLKTFIRGDYGSKGLLTFDLGMMYQISEQLRIGAHIFNPLNVKLSDYNDERIPSAITLGAEWKLNESLRILGEFEGDGSDKMQFKAGTEYMVNEWFALRAGVTTDPSIFTFGVGIHLDQLHIDFSSGMHQVLGYSPQFSMHYTFGDK